MIKVTDNEEVITQGFVMQTESGEYLRCYETTTHTGKHVRFLETSLCQATIILSANDHYFGREAANVLSSIPHTFLPVTRINNIEVTIN